MSEQPIVPPYEQFLLFGDSITQQSCSQDRGFAFMPALQNAYIRRLDIINRGFRYSTDALDYDPKIILIGSASGYNTGHALKVLPAFMPNSCQVKVRYMTVFFGANDACLPSSSTGQHIPLSQYKENLKNILQHPSMIHQQPRLILVTPPPVDEYQLEESQLLKGTSEILRTAEHTKLYADACREIGNEIGVVVLDLWSAFMSKAGWSPGQPLLGSKDVIRNLIFQSLFTDGLHLNTDGYKVLYGEMMKTLESAWSEKPEWPVKPEYLRFPLWEFAPK